MVDWLVDEEERPHARRGGAGLRRGRARAPRPQRVEQLHQPLGYWLRCSTPRLAGAAARMRRCDADAPVRVSWLRPLHCPLSLSETDAIQLATNEVLDATDGIAADGLVQAGYRLLAVDARRDCVLMHPSNRASLASYASSRGLSLVFTSLAPDPLRPRELDRAIFPHGGGDVACTARTLADASGASGWNDPRALLSMDMDQPHAAGSAAIGTEADSDSVAAPPFLRRLRSLRVRFAHACMHRRPLALAPGMRPRGASGGALPNAAAAALPLDIERTLVLATLTNRVALVLHASPLNATSETEAERHPVRISAGLKNMHIWVRHLVPPSGPSPATWTSSGTSGRVSNARFGGLFSGIGARAGAARATEPGAIAAASAPVSALLLINKGRSLATARLPIDATAPFSYRQLFVLPAWGNTSAHSATGVPPGTPLTAIMRSIDVPPLDAVLYLLFLSPEAAQRFELAGSRMRGGADAPTKTRGGGMANDLRDDQLGSSERRGALANDAVIGRAGQTGGAERRKEIGATDSGAGSTFAAAPLHLTLAVAVGAAVGACMLLRRVKQHRESGAPRWDSYAHSRLSSESPNDRPGTESKRKGRGRGTRPRLPSVWAPMPPAAASPLRPSPDTSCDGGYGYSVTTTPIPFNLRDAAENDGSSSLVPRRGFACSHSFQDVLEMSDTSRRGAQAGPPLVAGRPALFEEHVSVLSACAEEESEPHRRTPRQSQEDNTCFNV